MIIGWLRKQSGQTLIWVAVGMLTLLLFVALAIEVGNFYSERRKMQNSADAGALAGAYEICFGTESNWYNRAIEYATPPRNLGDPTVTQATRITDTVKVIARESITPFFAGVIGISSVNISAEAEAVCGKATSLCRLFPLTYRQDKWNEVPCGSIFYVFNSANELDDTVPYCDKCYCDQDENGNSIYVMGQGQRGWVNFPRPSAEYPDPYNCGNNCGGNQIDCIIKHNYGGNLKLPGPGQSMCLPGQPGVNSNLLQEVEKRKNDIVNILIWDNTCGAPFTGECNSNTGYNITGAGCVQIVDVKNLNFKPKPGFLQSDCKPEKVIAVKKLCNCNTTCGTTSGEICGDGDVCAVSLIK